MLKILNYVDNGKIWWYNIMTDYTLELIILDIKVGDILVMKKPHPCKSKEFEVLRIGADFKIKCLGCSHEVMVPRAKLEKNIKAVKGNENV